MQLMKVEQQLYKQQQGRQMQEQTWGDINEQSDKDEKDEDVIDENEMDNKNIPEET